MAAESSSVQQTSSESIVQKMGFFRVPDHLVKLSTKCSIELDAVRSPTSPLDLKFFTGLGTKSPRSSSLDASQNQKILLGDRVGLGLVDSLSDENPTPLGSRKVLLGSEMRITDNLSRKNSSTAPVQAGDNMSDGLKGSIMSLDDIVNSEDYTCVVSRGPNPRTTHIFGDRVFEFQVEQLMPDQNKGGESMTPHVKEGAMSFCCFCSEKLKEGKDIYMYQGESILQHGVQGELHGRR
ncbi:FCS-Like Zinc finger 11-like isoform X1 [Phragmites australis]|uniref:FCS-Like Zinc finger 11-like isoform X1 n=1 Tax=Phragmites australis TaxID=29695 RepID=UPI002D767F96|nr:FCS-Like Zinc finger 11-like isoform X1 [Phragmites australis]XP_062214193.1 FCS-Like Zinc finger 11-like isoform X1 [Phragmites australis]XP_062214202.1 FCS-Like Zinc finger 11-like isoform X1 [Phragmites australis]XP_062214211.1 FCS-Like Zinc finger 11-like isoform X1 [Phragmites australis]